MVKIQMQLRDGEPYLRTAYGILICYWDGVVHYLLYLAMIGAIAQRKNYRTLGLYWLGSLMMSIVVFLPGNLLGKYGSEIRPSFLLNVPYLLIPVWAGMKLFRQPRSLPCCTAEKVVLDCPSDSCFDYIYQYEPYLRDPVAYPKVQMLVYMFYVLPFFGLGVYGWLPDWALVCAGAVAQEHLTLTSDWCKVHGSKE
nr:transmembrane 6 superfamily member 2 [Pelodiscus sinensis]|eukprot:XP_014433647.1 transmembrane 6 superfamily member 2 [Pelodiscus sinensis]